MYFAGNIPFHKLSNVEQKIIQTILKKAIVHNKITNIHYKDVQILLPVSYAKTDLKFYDTIQKMIVLIEF